MRRTQLVMATILALLLALAGPGLPGARGKADSASVPGSDMLTEVLLKPARLVGFEGAGESDCTLVLHKPLNA